MDTTRRTVRFALLVIGVLFTLGLTVGTAAAETGPYVEDDGQDQGVIADGNEVLDATISRTPDAGSTLPFTGGDVIWLTVVGGGLVAIGGAAVVAGRRRHADV